MISMLETLMSALAGFRSEPETVGDRHPTVLRPDFAAVRRVRAEERDLRPYLEAASPGSGKLPARGARGRSRAQCGGGECRVIRFRKQA